MTERQETTPGMDPVPHAGAPAHGASTATAPDYSPRPVAVRRPDVVAGLLLLLAAAAAAVTLLLRWLAADDSTGLQLVRRGFTEFGDGARTLVDSGFWQPLTVVLGGGVLLVLGLLLFLPAKRHRFLGLVALLVAAAVSAAVLVPLVRASFDADTFRLGFWFAVAVAVLGLLGALKALLTGRRYRRDA
jgi:hypothetical protein